MTPDGKARRASPTARAAALGFDAAKCDGKHGERGAGQIQAAGTR
jgi:hypothetical protein